MAGEFCKGTGTLKSFIKKILYPAKSHGKTSTPHELEAVRKLNGIVGRGIIFDSKRGEHFAIYYLSFEDNSITCISSSDEHHVYPDVCLKTSAIVFAKTKSLERTARADIYIQEQNGTPRLLQENGTFPTFSSCGEKIYFERGRKELWSIDRNGENLTLLLRGKDSEFGDYAVVKPRVSFDQKYAVFTSDKGGRWHLWYTDLESGKSHFILKGCEGTWYPDNKNIAWIKKSGLLGQVGIYSVDVTNPSLVQCVQDASSDLGHEYFPFITSDGKYLLYSACPSYQHDHNSAAYQLFIKELSTGEITRLTFDTYTNRWAKVVR